jgi:DNA-binding transcriptional regulator YdaS (Cro superfamily)
MDNPREALEEAKRNVGGGTALAHILGIKQPSVSAWKTVPAKRVLAVEAATGVRRERLRPDLYPPDEIMNQRPLEDEYDGMP